MTQLEQAKTILERIVKTAAVHQDSQVLAGIGADAALALLSLQEYATQHKQLLEDEAIERIVEGVTRETVTHIEARLVKVAADNGLLLRAVRGGS